MIITILKRLRTVLERLSKYSFWIIVSILYSIYIKPLDTVVFLNVGQGDSIFIQKGNMQILVDGGADITVLYEIQKYMPFYDRKIEYIILTHPHDDHLIGLLHILERYEVENILYYPVCYKNTNYEFFISKEENLIEIKSGFSIGSDNFQLDTIWPNSGAIYSDGCYRSWNGNINNDSVVLSLEYIGRKFLLMGDAEKEVELELVKNNILGESYDILKAGHHCSKTSSSETFLKRIKPRLAICSAGEGNRFRHPSSETLKNFQSLNVQYLVTHQEGNIQIK
jgi:competence protein ComEC